MLTSAVCSRLYFNYPLCKTVLSEYIEVPKFWYTYWSGYRSNFSVAGSWPNSCSDLSSPPSTEQLILGHQSRGCYRGSLLQPSAQRDSAWTCHTLAGHCGQSSLPNLRGGPKQWRAKSKQIERSRTLCLAVLKNWILFTDPLFAFHVFAANCWLKAKQNKILIQTNCKIKLNLDFYENWALFFVFTTFWMKEIGIYWDLSCSCALAIKWLERNGRVNSSLQILHKLSADLKQEVQDSYFWLLRVCIF